MKNIVFRVIICLASCSFWVNLFGDLVLIGGTQGPFITSSNPQFPLANAFSLSDSTASYLNMPLFRQGEVFKVIIDPKRGNTLLAGLLVNDQNQSFVFKGSVTSSSLQAVPLPEEANGGFFTAAAFDTHGNALICGEIGYNGPPLVCRVPFNGNSPTIVSFPGTSDEVYLTSVAFFPNNTAVIVGIDSVTTSPLVYLLKEGESVATPVTLPDPSISGILFSVSIDSSGVAVMGGADYTNNQALIYRLAKNSSSLELIGLPGSNGGGIIGSIAFTSSNVAILVGGYTDAPLLYKLPQEQAVVSTIACALPQGDFSCLVIGSNDDILVGGVDTSSDQAIIYQIAPGASEALPISLVEPLGGYLYAAAIGEQDKAVFVGATTDNDFIIYTVSIKDPVAHRINASAIYPEGILSCVAIYSCTNARYDEKRIAPYYYQQVDQTKNVLQKAGML